MSFGKMVMACTIAIILHSSIRFYGSETADTRAKRQTTQTEQFLAGLKAQHKPFQFLRFKQTRLCFAIGYDASMLSRGGAMALPISGDACQALEQKGAKIEEIDELPANSENDVVDGGAPDVSTPDLN